MKNIYAQIELTEDGSGTVINIVMLDDDDSKDNNFSWVVITEMNPRPSIGWHYDGIDTFTDPTPPEQPPSQPNADEVSRGMTYVVYGQDGVDDEIQVCLKSADGNFSWKKITTE